MRGRCPSTTSGHTSLEMNASSLVVSFDIDGTMVFGDPPGAVAVETVCSLQGAGHIVGSASDRIWLDQQRLWQAAGVNLDFVILIHQLAVVKEWFPARQYAHVGDRFIDEAVADQAGFLFFHADTFPTELWRQMETFFPMLTLGGRS